VIAADIGGLPVDGIRCPAPRYPRSGTYPPGGAGPSAASPRLTVIRGGVRQVEVPRLPAAWEAAWRVRTGDYRIVYEIHDDVLLVLAVAVGHRRDIYRRR